MSFTEIGMRLGVWLIQIYMGGGVCGDQLAGDFIVCGTLPVVRRSCYSLVCVCLIINNGQEWRTQDGPYYFETMEIKITFDATRG